jgi:hypothetical protein
MQMLLQKNESLIKVIEQITKEKNIWQTKFLNLENLLKQNLQNLIPASNANSQIKNQNYSNIFNQINQNKIDSERMIKNLKTELEKNKAFTLELINQIKIFRKKLKKNHLNRSSSVQKIPQVKKYELKYYIAQKKNNKLIF